MKEINQLKKLIETMDTVNESTSTKFAVSVAWSQTDHETYLVSVNSRKDAERVAKEKLPGIHHVTGVTEIVKDLS